MTFIAHGLTVRSDLPIPEWLFGWAAAMVLFISFVALASLWPEPKLQREGWRPLSDGFNRVFASRVLEIACGAVGVFLLGVVVWSGFRGTEASTANFAPTFVYVIFWLGLVPVSVLFGDVFRALNPWRAIGRVVAWVARTAARTDLPAPLPYPERMGNWPAAAGIFAFAALELVYSEGSKPEVVATGALVYSAVTFVGMALYGVEAWTNRGEAFSVYYNLFSRISPVAVRDGRIGLRKPLSGLAALTPMPGTVPLLAVMIGSVTFDGASEACRVDQCGAGHRQLLQGRRVLAPGRPGDGVPDRPDRCGPVRVRLLHAGGGRRTQRGRGLHHQGAVASVRAHAGADRARLRGRSLPHAAGVPGAGDRVPGLGPSGRRLRLPRHRRPLHRLHAC